MKSYTITEEPIPKPGEVVSQENIITKRIRPDLLKDVVDLEYRGEIVTLPVNMYNGMSRSMNDYKIFAEVSQLHQEGEA